MGSWVTELNSDVQGVNWILEVARIMMSAVDGSKLIASPDRNISISNRLKS